MNKILLLTFSVILAASSLIAGPKCDLAKATLESQKLTFDEAAKTGQVKWKNKIAIPAKIGLLELSIKMEREAACEKFLESLQKDVEALNHN